MPEMILEALTHAADHFTDPAVRQAYQHLTHALGHTLTGQPFAADQPLTPTQIVLLRSALRRLSPAYLPVLDAAAQHLESTLTLTLNVDALVKQQGAATPRASRAANPLEGIADPWTYDVLISYSRKDEKAALRLYRDLRGAGLVVWLGDDVTPGTPEWQSAVEGAIRAAGCVVALLTPNAKESPWVEQEIKAAQTRRVPVLPLLLSGEAAAVVPASLSSARCLPLRDPREYRANLSKVIAAIRACNG